jgi:hypothetical protein
LTVGRDGAAATSNPQRRRRILGLAAADITQRARSRYPRRTPEHQHVEFSLFQGETLRASREQWSVDGGDASLAGLPMMAVVTMEGTPFSALTEARYRERAARSISFSLFARASSVLRC